MPSDALIRIMALCVVLAAFRAAFDIGIGMLLLRKPWRKVAPDSDPRTGNYLSFGLAFLVVVPWMVWVAGR